MPSNISCARCAQSKPIMEKAPLPGEDGQRILDAVCQDCWDEWRAEEVRTINELRLNFMDPEAQRTLRERMLSYLGLEEASIDPLCDRDENTTKSALIEDPSGE